MLEASGSAGLAHCKSIFKEGTYFVTSEYSMRAACFHSSSFSRISVPLHRLVAIPISVSRLRMEAHASTSSPPSTASPKPSRKATVSRKTKETQVEVTIDLDGTGQCIAETPVGFLNHMLDQISSHGLFDLTVRATGDTWIDDHHVSIVVSVTPCICPIAV